MQIVIDEIQLQKRNKSTVRHQGFDKTVVAAATVCPINNWLHLIQMGDPQLSML